MKKDLVNVSAGRGAVPGNRHRIKLKIFDRFQVPEPVLNMPENGKR